MNSFNYRFSWVCAFLCMSFSLLQAQVDCSQRLMRDISFAYTGGTAPARWQISETDAVVNGFNEGTVTGDYTYVPTGNFTNQNLDYQNAGNNLNSTNQYAVVQNPNTLNSTQYADIATDGMLVLNPLQGESNNYAEVNVVGLLPAYTYYVEIKVWNVLNLAYPSAATGNCHSWCNWNDQIYIDMKNNQAGAEHSGQDNRNWTGTNGTGTWSEGTNQVNNIMRVASGGSYAIITGEMKMPANGNTLTLTLQKGSSNNPIVLGIDYIRIYGCEKEEITISTGSTTVCEAEGVTLTAKGIAPAGGIITWHEGSLTGPVLQQSTSRTLDVLAGPASTTQTYYAVGDWNNVSVTLNPRVCCSSAAGKQSEVFIESFDVGISGTQRANIPELGTKASIGSAYSYASAGDINDGFYAVLQNSCAGGYWCLGHSPARVNENTGTPGSGALLVNATSSQDYVYRRELTGLCEDTMYEFSAYYASLNVGGETPVRLMFDVWANGSLTVGNSGTLVLDDAGQPVRTEVSPLNVPSAGNQPLWNKTSITFSTKGFAPGTVFYVQIRNSQPGGSGNDFMIDDIAVNKCIPNIYIESGSEKESLSTCVSTGVDLTINAAQSVLQVVAAGSPTGNVYYQWRESTSPTGPWTVIAGIPTQALLPTDQPKIKTPAATVGTVKYYQAKIASTQARAEDWTVSLLTGCGNDAMSNTFKVEIMSGSYISSFTSDSRCGAGQVSLTAVTSPAGGTVDWYDAATDGNLIGSSPSGTAWLTTVSETTTFYAEVQGSPCAGGRTEITATVNATPAAPTVTSPIDICLGGTASALTATGTGLLWYTTITGTGSTTAPIPNTATAGAISYWVSQTVNSCESPKAEIVVNITNTPYPANVTPYSACATTGAGTNITWASLINTAGTYTWYTDDTTPTSMTEPAAFNSSTAKPAETFWVVVQESGSGCLTSRTAVTATVNALPAIVVNAQDVSCPGGDNGAVSATLNAGLAPFAFSWKDALGTEVSTLQNVSNLPKGIYTLTVTDANICSATANSITVAETPDKIPPVVPAALPAQELTGTACDFKVPDFIAAVRTASSDNCTAQADLVITQAPAANTSITANTTVTITVADASDNAVATTVEITMPEMPTIIFNPIAEVCENGTPITLTASNSTSLGMSFPGSFSGTGVIGTSFSPNVAGAGTHSIVYTIYPYGCELKATQPVIVNPMSANIAVNAPDVCPEGTLTVTAVPNIYDRYEWRVNGEIDQAQTGSTYIYDRGKESGDIILFSAVAFSDKGCVSNPADATATVMQTPTITVLPQPILCATNPEEGTRIQWRDLVTTSENQVQWFAAEDSPAPFIPESIDQSVPGTYTIYAAALSNGGCLSDGKPVEVSVTVNPNPVLEKIDTSDLENIRVIISGGVKPYTYDLEGHSGNTDGPVDFGTLPIGRHTLLITDGNGCQNTAFVPVLDFKLICAEYFTPNGDGRHDTWEIKYLENYLNDDVTIHIYDRNGKEILRKTAAEYKDKEWDGTFNGNMMPSTDYWYVITIGKLGQRITGHFSLKR